MNMLKKIGNWICKDRCCPEPHEVPVFETREMRIEKLRKLIKEQDDQLNEEYRNKKVKFLEEQKLLPKTRVVFVTDLGEFPTDAFEPSVSFSIDRWSHRSGYYDHDEERRLESEIQQCRVHYHENTSRKNAELFAHHWTASPHQYVDRHGFHSPHDEYYHHPGKDILVPRREIKLVRYETV